MFLVVIDKQAPSGLKSCKSPNTRSTTNTLVTHPVLNQPSFFLLRLLQHLLHLLKSLGLDPAAAAGHGQEVMMKRACAPPSPSPLSGSECYSPGSSPLWGAGRVASGDAGLQAVRALQAQSVVRLMAARWRLVMQDGVMDCWGQI